MCDLNGPFKLCTCSSIIDFSKPHWILHQNVTNEGEEMIVTIGMMVPVSLIDKIERRKILRRLNTLNVFDFDYQPEENDQLELNFQEDDGHKLTFKGGKWKMEEWFGNHPIFEHKSKKVGLIESHPSKLKEVYKEYLEVLKEGEIDITESWIYNVRMSEKRLIELMKKRINGNFN